MPKRKPLLKAGSTPDGHPSANPLGDAANAASRGPRRKLRQPPRSLPWLVSLLMLVAVLVLTAAVFFRVMAQFLIPLFLAGVLVVVFEPIHRWVAHRVGGKNFLAAGVTTGIIFLVVLIPTMLLGLLGFLEAAPHLNQESVESAIAGLKDLATRADKWFADQDLPFSLASTLESARGDLGKYAGDFINWIPKGLKALATFLIGVVVMTLAVFYFFLDGPAMIRSISRLLPLNDDYEIELLEKFSEVSRAVVVATVLSAVVQGVLAGIGYWFALPGGSPVVLLTVVTTALAMVPFVGALAVWAPVAAYLILQGGDFFWPGVGLALYGALLVSTIDNVIKPVVLHGQSKLHPLLALLSILGGITVLGPVGILVGPMLVAFLQALLNMLRRELDDLEDVAQGALLEKVLPPPPEAGGAAAAQTGA